MTVSNTMRIKQSAAKGGGFDNIKISYIKPNGRAEEGTGTVSLGDNQHVQGRYNIEDTEEKYAHIVGNGKEGAPSNAHTLDWSGNAWFAGNVLVQGSDVNSSFILPVVDLLWECEDPYRTFWGGEINEYFNGDSSTYLRQLTLKGKAINIADYSGLIIIGAYNIESDTPVSTLFVPCANWNELNSVVNSKDQLDTSTAYNMPIATLTANLHYNTCRPLYFLLYKEDEACRVEILFDHGYLYKTYGVGTTDTNDDVCIPLAIYGIRNINK